MGFTRPTGPANPPVAFFQCADVLSPFVEPPWREWIVFAAGLLLAIVILASR